MKKLFAAILLSAAALTTAGCAPRPVYGPPPPPPGVQIHDMGIHDGFEAARNDVANNRPPNFARHPKYRNPPIPQGGGAWDDYRNGFRQGYERFLHQGPPPGM
jgi:hypothetical protein